jgi:hypothetical protein
VTPSTKAVIDVHRSNGSLLLPGPILVREQQLRESIQALAPGLEFVSRAGSFAGDVRYPGLSQRFYRLPEAVDTLPGARAQVEHFHFLVELVRIDGAGTLKGETAAAAPRP